jgi:hypothetical protein
MQEPETKTDKGSNSQHEARADGVVVLGPGRSGTSSVSGAFVAAGYFAGREDEVLGAGVGNPLGHYEPLPVLRLNEDLLAAFDCSWWAAQPDPARQLAARDQFEPRIAATLAAMKANAHGKPLVVKEPRINSLLPLWGPVIDGGLHPVLTVRDPVEIALSQARRDGTTPAHALAAWEAQMATLLDWLQGRIVTVAPYRELLASPTAAADLIAEASAHLLPAFRGEVTAGAASKAIHPQQRNEVADVAESSEYLTARQSELWKFLASLPLGDLVIDAPEALRTPAPASLEAIAKQNEQIDFATEHQSLAARLKEMGEQTVALARELAAIRERSVELGRELVESRNRSARLRRELTERERQRRAGRGSS